MITLREQFDAKINCVCFIYDFSHGQSVFFKTLNEVLVASKRRQFLLAIVTVLLKQPTENMQFIL